MMTTKSLKINTGIEARRALLQVHAFVDAAGLGNRTGTYPWVYTWFLVNIRRHKTDLDQACLSQIRDRWFSQFSNAAPQSWVLLEQPDHLQQPERIYSLHSSWGCSPMAGAPNWYEEGNQHGCCNGSSDNLIALETNKRNSYRPTMQISAPEL